MKASSNPEGHQNCITGSKVISVLLKGGTLPAQQACLEKENSETLILSSVPCICVLLMILIYNFSGFREALIKAVLHIY